MAELAALSLHSRVIRLKSAIVEGSPVRREGARRDIGVATMARYVALLRGINVGGNNVIRMADLRACLEVDGFGDVRTYIQSGNVLFTASGSSATLTARLERTLSAGFGYGATVAVRSARPFRAIVDAAPEGFGIDRERYRCDVLFLMPPLTPARAIADVPTREGVDRAWTGPGCCTSNDSTPGPDRAGSRRSSRCRSIEA
jgi:uncharacterized protein (DUF1697 family)